MTKRHKRTIINNDEWFGRNSLSVSWGSIFIAFFCVISAIAQDAVDFVSDCRSSAAASRSQSKPRVKKNAPFWGDQFGLPRDWESKPSPSMEDIIRHGWAW